MKMIGHSGDLVSGEFPIDQEKQFYSIKSNWLLCTSWLILDMNAI